MGTGRNRGRGQTAIEGIEEQGPAVADAVPLRGIKARRVMSRVERAVSESISAARPGPADARLRGAETLARELARGIDIAAGKADPYALAQLSPKLLDVLRELGLAGGAAAAVDPTTELLADLATPE